MKLSDWKKVKLSELGTIVGGGTPSTKKEEYYGGDIPWITPKDLANFGERYIEHGSRNITLAGLENSSAKILPVGSILFSSRAPIGYIAIASNNVSTNQGFKSIIPNSDVDSLFLYYLLKFNKDKIENMGSGTTFKEVSASIMKSIEVFIPTEIVEQRKISAILGAIDDKIENNKKINHHLEQMAQAIFKSWFVDFEPFGGVKPSDWETANLTDIAEYLNGLAMQKYRPFDDEESLPVLKIKELRQGTFDSSSDLCSANIKSQYIIQDGDVIFSWSGSLLVDFWTGGTGGLNQHLFKVSSQKYDKWFYYSWTKYYLEEFIAIAADKATTMGHITRRSLEKAKILIPNDHDYKSIGLLLAPIYRQIISNRIESRKLTEMRDTLLPKLLSGEISVSQATK